jgi:Calx-beta domain-containing protein
VTVVEGDSGTTTARFDVTLADSDLLDFVTVDFSTLAQTASNDDDYDGTSGSLTFALGSSVQTIEVPVRGDTHAEPAEAFTVKLSDASGASITDDQAVGTIQNDDGTPPAISVADGSTKEGGAGTHLAPVTITLDRAPTQAITVHLDTTDGTAKQPGDYTTTSGTVLFNVGERTKTIGVPVTGNTRDDVNRAFSIDLTSPMNATVADGHATVTIVDDEPDPKVSVGNCSKYEGNTGTASCRISITLDHVSAHTVTVRYATSDGTARAASDYVSRSGTLSFPAGTTKTTISLAVRGDLTSEPLETFKLRLSSPTGASIGDGSGIASIRDDDGPPAISIGDVRVTEGDAGTRSATFVIRLSKPSTKTVSTQFGTASDTARANEDYRPVVEALTFNPGQTSNSVTVAIIGDTRHEGNERFYFKLFSPANAVIADSYAIGTILDDD